MRVSRKKQEDDGGFDDCDVNRNCQERVIMFMKRMFEQGSPVIWTWSDLGTTIRRSDARLLGTLTQHTCEALTVLASARVPNFISLISRTHRIKLIDIDLRRAILRYIPIASREPVIGRTTKACILPEQIMAFFAPLLDQSGCCTAANLRG
jgi:hypothetical protein